MTNLQRYWRFIAEHNNLEVIIPFVFDGGESQIEVEVLVRAYGARNGMLILSDFEMIKDYVDVIHEQGYGFSCMSQPDEQEVGSLDGVDEMLADWGHIS